MSRESRRKKLGIKEADLKPKKVEPVLTIEDEQGNKYIKTIENGIEVLKMVESYDGTCRY